MKRPKPPGPSSQGGNAGSNPVGATKARNPCSAGVSSRLQPDAGRWPRPSGARWGRGRLSQREDQLTAVEERLRRESQQLRDREGQLEARERRLELATKLAALPTTNRVKTGRNERCPCGSGLKYKHCHGRPRQP
jgi:hypothetical protein